MAEGCGLLTFPLNWSVKIKIGNIANWIVNPWISIRDRIKLCRLNYSILRMKMKLISWPAWMKLKYEDWKFQSADFNLPEDYNWKIRNFNLRISICYQIEMSTFWSFPLSGMSKWQETVHFNLLADENSRIGIPNLPILIFCKIEIGRLESSIFITAWFWKTIWIGSWAVLIDQILLWQLRILLNNKS